MHSRNRSRSRSPLHRNSHLPRDRRPIVLDSDRMVYLSNLPFDVRWDELKDICIKFVFESAFIDVLESQDGKPKGCAVLDFNTRAAAQRAVEILPSVVLKGRNIIANEIRDPMAFFKKLKAKDGIDFLANRNLTYARKETRPRRDNASQRAGVFNNETYGLSPAFLTQLNIQPPLVNRVFVTNIPYNCKVGKLIEVFSLAGKITDLDVEGKTKGTAVIEYSHPIEAVQAISMFNNQQLFDRTLLVKMDQFEKKNVRAPGELPPGLHGIGMGLGANGAPLVDVSSVLASFANVQSPFDQNSFAL